MSKGKILRHYVSQMDQFLNKFDEEHPQLSASQLQEKKKYARVYALRDDGTPQVDETKLPEDF